MCCGECREPECSMHITEGQIRQLQSGGVSRATERDPFKRATKLWWDTIGSAIDARTIKQYRAKIAPVPAYLIDLDDRHPALNRLMLDDPRLPRTVRAELIGVKHKEYGYTDDTLVEFDARHATPSEPYWFRAHDGRPNRGRKPSDCRAECTGDLLGGTGDVLLALFLSDRAIVRQHQHIMDGPGSVSRDIRRWCSYLRVWDGGPELSAHWVDGANPSYGSVVFRRL